MAGRAGSIASHRNRGDECISKAFVVPRRYVKFAQIFGMEAQSVRACNLPPSGSCQLIRGNKQTDAIVWHPKFQESRGFAAKFHEAAASKGVLRPVICSDARVGHSKRKRDPLHKPRGNHIWRTRLHIERRSSLRALHAGDRRWIEHHQPLSTI